MPIIKCKVYSTVLINYKEFWRLRDISNSEEFVYPIYKQDLTKISVGKVIPFRKSVGNDRKPRLELIDREKTFLPQKGAFYNFKILRVETFLLKDKSERTKIVFIDETEIERSVLAFRWQKELFFSRGEIRVRFEGLDFRERIVYTNQDFRHPIYLEGEIYLFTVVDLIDRITKDDKPYQAFQLKGEDGLIYQTSVIAGQNRTIKVDDEISCKVIIVNDVVRLSQVNVADPYFLTIENIINEKKIISKFFLPILNSANPSYHEIKFRDQYNEKRAFWVFTFCKHVIPKYFDESIKRLDYKAAYEINELSLAIEKWILTKGIISAIPNKLLADSTLERANLEINKGLSIRKVTTLLSSQSYYSLLDGTSAEINTLDEIYYIIKFIDFQSLNEVKYINKILRLISSQDVNEVIVANLIQIISKQKNSFLNSELENIFELIENGNARFKSSQYKSKFFNWAYCEYQLYLNIKMFEQANVLLGIIQRQYFYIVEDINVKRYLILRSYEVFQNFKIGEQFNPFYFADGIKLNHNVIRGNEAEELPNDWSKLESIFIGHSIIKVSVGKRFLNGFEVLYENKVGFLPTHRTKDIVLKNSVLDEVDYEIAVRCILFNKEFKFFIVEQLDTDHSKYFSLNKSIYASKNLIVKKGIIVRVDDNGVFVTTESGIGRLSRKDISEHIWDLDRLKRHFKPQNTLFYVSISDNLSERQVLSLKPLYDTDYRVKYIEFLNRVDDDHLIDYEEFYSEPDKTLERRTFDLIQSEKAYCFEQYALIQIDLEKKILNLKMANELFESVKSLRSDYANIYTSYFETLAALERAINDYTPKTLENVNKQVLQTLEKITSTALSSFPDFEKLLYFLNIILLFNSKVESDLDKLFQYVKDYSGKGNNENLKIIAKITLSNNLMISSGNDVTDFSKKNLGLIFSYIQNGVLSLKDAEFDKVKKENESKVKYWSDRILEGESPILEFKSSLRFPVLDEKRIQELNHYKSLDNKLADVQKKISKINGDLAYKSITHSAMKTLCAFANSNGGTLLIGVTDDQKIFGLDSDYSTLKQKNRDGFGKHIDELVKSYFGGGFASLLRREFVKFPEGDIMIIEVYPSPEEVFMLRDEENVACEDLYIRNTTTTEVLKGTQLAKFIKLKIQSAKLNVTNTEQLLDNKQYAIEVIPEDDMENSVS
ncbi:ATP-binding protein [Pedobacter sp. CFBP9032]|uniref:AlbA family DNA-binding domain-containing protein n=1 Tax=Pedobacter sp. CFBP9032 TaxID=3096539 RepID=UPI002A6AB9AC|nr:ATP-binding protein [Pedobacter sp. CFBP9032]MDY0905627.1 ATP-binding protein [Pedobacter sp. CFBP9032]